MLLPLRSRRGIGITVAVVAAVAAGPLALLSTQPATAAPPPTDRTSALEARRVDRVQVGKIEWSTCGTAGAECARIRLPLDYDEPNGPTTVVFLGRMKAAKPEQRIGTLFFNPGGPGGSAAAYAAAADLVFDQRILDRFDIVGVDPRGVGSSDKVSCFKTAAEREAVFAGFSMEFPVTPAETRTYIRSSRAYAKACGTTGGALAASMSTAQVARDMDVVRRALGDKKLSFHGGSYGTYLGQVYANMFPDRVRALALDGMIDPVAYAGAGKDTGRTAEMNLRSGTGRGTYVAFRELMRRCDTVGPDRCIFAGSGNSLKKFDVVAQRLKKTPLTVNDKTLTYPFFMKAVTNGLYDGAVGPKLTAFLQDAYTATDPTVIGSRRAEAAARAIEVSVELRSDEPIDASYTVTCSDAEHPKNPNSWTAFAKEGERRAPNFNNLWTWGTIPCAESIWTARDEDRYLGPFNRRTTNPALMIGNYYDPGTPYTAAVAASKQLPNSRLLSSDSWGHTAYFNNTCVSNALVEYLLNGTLPAKGTVCKGSQPFEQAVTPPTTAQRNSTARPGQVRPNVSGLGGYLLAE